jgi:hypothetical protein
MTNAYMFSFKSKHKTLKKHMHTQNVHNVGSNRNVFQYSIET